MSFSSPDGLGTKLLQGFEANNPIMGSLLGKVTGITQDKLPTPSSGVTPTPQNTDPGSQPISLTPLPQAPQDDFSANFQAQHPGIGKSIIKMLLGGI